MQLPDSPFCIQPVVLQIGNILKGKSKLSLSARYISPFSLSVSST